jgi:hypothetical protein
MSPESAIRKPKLGVHPLVLVAFAVVALVRTASGHFYAGGFSYERSTSGYTLRLSELRFIIPYVRVAPGFGCMKMVVTGTDYSWYERQGSRWLERKDKVGAIVLLPVALSVMLAGDGGVEPDHEPLETVTLDISASLLRAGQFQSTAFDACVCYCPGAFLNLRAGYSQLFCPGFATADRVVPARSYGRAYLGAEVVLGGWLAPLRGVRMDDGQIGVTRHAVPVRKEVIFAVPMLQALFRGSSGN